MMKTKLASLTFILIVLIGIMQIGVVSAATTTDIQVGINYLSNGNRYDESDSILEQDFAYFQQNGISVISIRVMWISIESSRGQYRSDVINNYRRVLTIAEKYNIKVNIDFWSHFHSFSTYWRPSYVTSNRDIYLNNNLKQNWFDMVTYVVNQLKGYDAIYSWAVMNEPFYDYRSDREPMEQFIVESADLIRRLDNRPITCRFTVDYNPWNGLFDYSILDSLDIISITEYMDPEWGSSYHGATWNTIRQAVEWSNEHNKDFWIIEFGISSGSNEAKRLHYQDSIEMFQELGIRTMFAWAWQSRSPQNEAYNIALGTADGSSCFFELVEVAGYAGSYSGDSSASDSSSYQSSTDSQTITSSGSDSTQTSTTSQTSSTSDTSYTYSRYSSSRTTYSRYSSSRTTYSRYSSSRTTYSRYSSRRSYSDYRSWS